VGHQKLRGRQTHKGAPDAEKAPDATPRQGSGDNITFSGKKAGFPGTLPFFPAIFQVCSSDECFWTLLEFHNGCTVSLQLCLLQRILRLQP